MQMQEKAAAKAKAKASCRAPAPAPDANEEPVAGRRRRGGAPAHVLDGDAVDVQRQARLAASQARADNYVQQIRSYTECPDLQPPVGFTAKLL